ncbi:nonribosomal peptide synthase 11 [Aureobasidium pullulans]|nr:nonribosomal peptide synthase 11 [Aureobasidium pullulans]
MCAANTNITSMGDATSVGFGLGATLWIADVNKVTRLAPVGAVGELLIEGPIVGQGYLGDKRKTQESLVSVPEGFLPGESLAPVGPLFRTRDLACYNVDGSISFIGRADTQIKINGQRVEVGEVEYHLGRYLPADLQSIVEALQWPSGRKQLIAFLFDSGSRWKPKELRKLAIGSADVLSDRLPKYMIPSAFFPLSSIPMTATGKIDRKAIRAMALQHPDRLLDVNNGLYSGSDRKSKTTMTKEQKILHRLWVLIMNLESVELADNFFSRGGDSLAAMRLVSALRSEGYEMLTVADIFSQPRLLDLASLLEKSHNIPKDVHDNTVAPFRLLHEDDETVEHIRRKAADLCRCQVHEVEDIYPCSPIQEEMITLSARDPINFVTRIPIKLPSDIDTQKLYRAWDTVATSIPILRTRIVDLKLKDDSVSRLLQVVLSLPVSITEHFGGEVSMGLGDSLFRVGIVNDGCRSSPGSRPSSLVFIMHHSIYDGWFLNDLGEELMREYVGQPRGGIGPYRNFIQYISSYDREAASQYWRRNLRSIRTRQFPRTPGPHYRPCASTVLERPVIHMDWSGEHGMTPNTILQAAWAMVLSKHSGADDVVFGATLLGRQAPLKGIERVGGPTLATVPVRIAFDWESSSPLELLQSVQAQSSEMIQFMHLGIKNIRQLSFDAEQACHFSTFLVVQPKQDISDTNFFGLGTGKDDIEAFNSYSLMLECSLTADGLVLRASFDEKVIGIADTTTLLSEMERVTTSLSMPEKYQVLLDISILTDSERRSIVNSKIEGQRAQIRETEVLVQSCLPQTISAFIDLVDSPVIGDRLVAFVDAQNLSSTQYLELLAELDREMMNHLPLHMLPSAFLMVEGISHSEDPERTRSSLHQLALQAAKNDFVLRSTLVSHSQSDQPSTESEIILQQLWSSVLDVDRNACGNNTSFIALGGDSLAAMRLVAAARTTGYTLTVAEIFQKPLLVDMAARMRSHIESPEMLPAFTLLDQSVDKQYLARVCNVDPSAIEDAYPCSPLQEAMMAGTMRWAWKFVTVGVTNLSEEIDVERLKRAWEKVSSMTPILRTRIVEHAGTGLLQVVVKAPVQWSTYRKIEDIPDTPMGVNDPLLRFALIGVPKTDSRFILRTTIHHAIYDRWSASLVLEAVESVYRQQMAVPKSIPYKVFINHLMKDIDLDQANQFWTAYLSNLDAPQYPRLPDPKYKPHQTGIQKHRISNIDWSGDFTSSTLLRAAWTIVVSQYSGSQDVVFGSVLMGRHTSLPGIDRVAGPTLATVPMRVKVRWDSSKHEFLDGIQSQTTKMIPFEHHGIDKIRRLSPEAQQACEFQSLLVVQPLDDTSRGSPAFSLQLDGDDSTESDAHAIVMEVSLLDAAEGVATSLSFDGAVLNQAQAQSMLTQFEHVLRHICDRSSDTSTIGDLDLLDHNQRCQIWARNETVPQAIDSCLGDIVADSARKHAAAPAIHAWDGSVNYSQFYGLAERLAYQLIHVYGVKPGKTVFVCFYKSVWAPVAMLATTLAGYTTVLLDPLQPIERLHNIVRQAGPGPVLVPPSAMTKIDALGPLIVISEKTIMALPTYTNDKWKPCINSDDALYIIFTSGSTGAPKGVIITHGNDCSAFMHQSRVFGLHPTSRVLDLASYSFDVVWEQFWMVFCTGACLCIPSDDDRKDNIAGMIRDFEINYLDTTPSLARTIDPSSVATLRHVVLGGEPVDVDDVTRWGDVEVRNAYGPSECTVTSTIARYREDFTAIINIGRPCGLNAWVISRVQPSELCPIGAVGELFLEGPLVGNGYLNNETKTKASFLQDPPWLPEQIAQQGSRRKGRFYRTGDLVSCDHQGILRYLGRIDTQVKIRGQRVELEEIELRARRFMGAAVSVAAAVSEIKVSSHRVQTLTLFLCSAGSTESRLPIDLQRQLSKHLARHLPPYMVPSKYFTVSSLPKTASGKLDRKSLHELGAQSRFAASQESRSIIAPTTEYGNLLRHLWSQILCTPEEKISEDDSFLDLGGDSLAAIRLVGVARQQGIPLSVVMIFKYPQLGMLAEHVTGSKNCIVESRPDSSLSPKRSFHLPDVSDVARILSVAAREITSILPVTDFQQYAVACAYGTPRTEWNYFEVDFGSNVDHYKLKNACTELLQHMDIFRTLFLPYHDRYVQVRVDTLDSQVSMVDVDQNLDRECEAICLQDLSEPICPRTPFSKFFIVRSCMQDTTKLILRMSHAHYDGFSLARLADCIGALYNKRPLPVTTSISSYIETALHHSDESYTHWRTVLQYSAPPLRLSDDMPSAAKKQKARVYVQDIISDLFPARGITTAALFLAAWGMALSKVTRATDIVYGRAASGRALTSSDVLHENVMGPCLNLVPTRLRLHGLQTASDILQSVQRQLTASIPHETVGFSEIVRNCTDWPVQTSFESVLYFQRLESPRCQVGDKYVELQPIHLDRADSLEPPRVNIVPRGKGVFVLELSFHEYMCTREMGKQLLHYMKTWLEEACVRREGRLPSVSKGSQEEMGGIGE